MDGEDNDFDVDQGEIVDHNEVNIIGDEQEFLGHDPNMVDGSDDMRNLNRQSDNIANLEQQMRGAGGLNQMADYNDELDGDDDGLDELQDEYDENQQLILDDQNLDMDDMHDLGPGKAGGQRRPGETGVQGEEELDLGDIDPALLEAAVQ